MSMTSDLLRGNTDMLILFLLEENDSYGYEINKEISRRSEGMLEFKEATLYSAFKRLEKSGAIISYWGNDNSTARRKYYSITKVGEALLGVLRKEWNKSKEIIDGIMKGREQDGTKIN